MTLFYIWFICITQDQGIKLNKMINCYDGWSWFIWMWSSFLTCISSNLQSPLGIRNLSILEKHQFNKTSQSQSVQQFRGKLNFTVLICQIISPHTTSRRKNYPFTSKGQQLSNKYKLRLTSFDLYHPYSHSHHIFIQRRKKGERFSMIR